MSEQGKKNIKKYTNFTPAEKAEFHRVGGIAGAKSKRSKKTMREIAQMLLKCPPTKEEIIKLQADFPDIDIADVNNAALISAMQIKRAQLGDSKAFEVIRDTAGEKPVDRTDNFNHGPDCEGVSFVDGKPVVKLK